MASKRPNTFCTPQRSCFMLHYNYSELLPISISNIHCPICHISCYYDYVFSLHIIMWPSLVGCIKCSTPSVCWSHASNFLETENPRKILIYWKHSVTIYIKPEPKWSWPILHIKYISPVKSLHFCDKLQNVIIWEGHIMQQPLAMHLLVVCPMHYIAWDRI